VRQQYDADVATQARILAAEIQQEDLQRTLQHQLREAKKSLRARFQEEFARRLEEEVAGQRREITDQIRTDLESKFRAERAAFRPQQFADSHGDELDAVLPELCRAAGIRPRHCDIAGFLRIVSQLSRECIEIREQTKVMDGPLIGSFLGLRDEVAHLDQYKCRTRGVLVMQAQQIDGLRTHTRQSSWMNWAKALYAEMHGCEFDGDDNSTTMRDAIESSVTMLMRRHKGEGSPQSSEFGTLPSWSRVVHENAT
jgi:hypothetical protein